MTDENPINRLDEIGRKALEALEKVSEATDLQRWKTENLGRSAPVMEIFSHLTGLEAAMRPVVGQAANRLKQQLETGLCRTRRRPSNPLRCRTRSKHENAGYQPPRA